MFAYFAAVYGITPLIWNTLTETDQQKHIQGYLAYLRSPAFAKAQVAKQHSSLLRKVGLAA